MNTKQKPNENAIHPPTIRSPKPITSRLSEIIHRHHRPARKREIRVIVQRDPVRARQKVVPLAEAREAFVERDEGPVPFADAADVAHHRVRLVVAVI